VQFESSPKPGGGLSVVFLDSHFLTIDSNVVHSGLGVNLEQTDVAVTFSVMLAFIDLILFNGTPWVVFLDNSKGFSLHGAIVSITRTWKLASAAILQ
jgi:hypothetical protein